MHSSKHSLLEFEINIGQALVHVSLILPVDNVSFCMNEASDGHSSIQNWL